MIALFATTACGGVVAGRPSDGGPLLDAGTPRDGSFASPVVDAGLQAVFDGTLSDVDHDATSHDNPPDTAACEPEWVDAFLPPGGQCCRTNMDCDAPGMCCQPAPEKRGGGWGYCFVCPISQ